MRFDRSMPSGASIERLRSIRRLLQPMEQLTRGFMGRETELTELRTFVGVLDAQNATERVVRFFRGLKAKQEPPLMLHGIGGIGKSTLLAEFIRQHVNSPVPFPWAYLDFDNPRLNVATLSTLISEMAQQLRAQYPGSDWDEVVSESESRSLVTEAATSGSGGAGDAHTILVSNLAEAEKLRSAAAQDLASMFAYRLRQAMEGSQLEKMMRISEHLPFLVVLDTFEEVQKRGVERARVLWTFLSFLAAEFPRIRVIVAGRAPAPEVVVNGYTAKPMVLKAFDEGSALSFLYSRGVTDSEAALALVRQVGGNPLNLKLAAQVAKLQGAGRKGIEGLKTTSFFVFSASERVIQGQLYHRILARMSNPDLQKIAHPGLVIRRVTADIIQKVLAEPCGLPGMDEDGAGYLFKELSKQVDMVTREPDGALRHRQDVRRVMLKHLEAERPEQVRQIHEGAFRYYSPRSEAAEKIEKIYHALQLSMSEAQIRQIWTPEAEESLLSSIDEFPPSSQLIVRLCSGTEAGPELRALADLDQWERLAEQKARQALEYGDYLTAANVLAERTDRSAGSALFAIDAVCATAIGQFEEALAFVDRGIQSAGSVNRLDRLVELLRLQGEIYELTGRSEDADGPFAEAQALAMRIAFPVLALQIYANRARLRRGGTPPIDELNQIVEQTKDADFASVRFHLTGLYRTCGPESIPLLLKGLRVFKLRELPYISDVEWPEIVHDLARRDRLNDALQYLLGKEPTNIGYRRGIAEVLEMALNPNAAARSA